MPRFGYILLVAAVLLWGFTLKSGLTPYHFPAFKFFPPMPAAHVKPITVQGAELGRYLFYDTILSSNRNMACASCHKQERAFSDAPNRFINANTIALTKRNTPALFNLAWQASLFWDGRVKSIEEQVFHPVRDRFEMNLPWKQAADRLSDSKFYRQKFAEVYGKRKIDSVLVADALGQFLRTLVSYSTKYDRVLAGDGYLNTDERDGLVLMNDMTKGDCLHCHTTDADALGTTGGFSNNGLDAVFNVADYRDKGLGGYTGKVYDYGKFKIPSLRNIALTAPYMHDGRFETLEQVMDFYSEGVNPCINIDSKMGMAYQHGVHLTAEEKRKIIAFLNTLTDSVFITDKRFGNPFVNQ